MSKRAQLVALCVALVLAACCVGFSAGVACYDTLLPRADRELPLGCPEFPRNLLQSDMLYTLLSDELASTERLLTHCLRHHICHQGPSHWIPAISFSKQLAKLVGHNAIEKSTAAQAFASWYGQGDVFAKVSSPLKFLFEHDLGSNPFCDSERLAAAVQEAVPLLLSQDSTAVLDETHAQLFADFRDLVTTAFREVLTADCAKPDADLQDGDDEVDDKLFIAADPLGEYIQKLILIIGNDKKTGLTKPEKGLINKISKIVKRYTSQYHMIPEGESLKFDFPEVMKPMEARMTKMATQRELEETLFGSISQEFHLKSSAEELGACSCEDVLSTAAIRLLNRLDDLALMDLGTLSFSEPADGNRSNAKLMSDKPYISYVLHRNKVDRAYLANMARQTVMVEAGSTNVKWSLRFYASHAYEQLPKMRAGFTPGYLAMSEKVKAVLIGIPIAQNIWASMATKNLPADPRERAAWLNNFKMKTKWLFVFNIAWAVWHQLDSELVLLAKANERTSFLQHQAVVLGLWTTSLSIASQYDWDPQTGLYRQKGDEDFVDWFVATYTAWNYSLFETIFHESKRWDMMIMALGIPIQESILNHGNSRFWANYRRDQLMHTVIECGHKQ